jgi:hypothetical protein
VADLMRVLENGSRNTLSNAGYNAAVERWIDERRRLNEKTELMMNEIRNCDQDSIAC